MFEVDTAQYYHCVSLFLLSMHIAIGLNELSIFDRLSSRLLFVSFFRRLCMTKKKNKYCA